MAADSSEGVMTAEQMRRCLFAEMKSNCAEVELEEMLLALDLDNDGKVRMDDFVRLLATEHSQLVREETPNCADKCIIL
jgi:Ca2+-binding EF-hand superfamily protein